MIFLFPRWDMSWEIAFFIHFPIILLVGRWSYKDLAKVLCQRFFQQWSAAPSSPRWLIFGGGKSPFIYLTHWVWVCFLLVNQFTFYLGPNTTSAEVSKVSTRWSLSWPCWPGALKAPEFWRFFHAPNPGGDFDVGEVHHRFVTENTDLSTDLFPVKTLRIFVSHLLPPARANVGKRLTQGFFQRFVNVRSLLINKMHRFHISMIYTYFHSSYHLTIFGFPWQIHPTIQPSNRSQPFNRWPSGSTGLAILAASSVSGTGFQGRFNGLGFWIWKFEFIMNSRNKKLKPEDLLVVLFFRELLNDYENAYGAVHDLFFPFSATQFMPLELKQCHSWAEIIFDSEFGKGRGQEATLFGKARVNFLDSNFAIPWWNKACHLS